MTTDAESNDMTLKERLEHGEYKVDTKKVAEAMLCNPLWTLVLACGTHRPADSRPSMG